MSIPQTTLNLSIQGMFPGKVDAVTDPKCVIIAQVINAFVKTCDMSQVIQEDVTGQASQRYQYLSENNRINLPEADSRAYTMYKKGIPIDVAQKYYSFRLTEHDAKSWTIHLY